MTGRVRLGVWITAVALGAAVVAGLGWLAVDRFRGPVAADLAGTVWRTPSGTTVEFLGDGTLNASGLPKDLYCWKPLGERKEFTATGKWRLGTVTDVGEAVHLTLTTPGNLLPCQTALVFEGHHPDWRLAFNASESQELFSKVR